MINTKETTSIMDKLVTWAVLGLLGWNVMTTQQLSVDVAVLKNTVDTGFSDRYTATEAASRSLIIDRRIDYLQDELSELEERVRKHHENHK